MLCVCHVQFSQGQYIIILGLAKWRWCVVWVSVRVPGGFIHNSFFNSVFSPSLSLLQCYALKTAGIRALGNVSTSKLVYFFWFCESQEASEVKFTQLVFKNPFGSFSFTRKSSKICFINKVSVGSYTQLFTSSAAHFSTNAGNSATHSYCEETYLYSLHCRYE